MWDRAMIFHGIASCVALLYAIVLCSGLPFICFKMASSCFMRSVTKKIKQLLSITLLNCYRILYPHSVDNIANNISLLIN